MTSDGVDENCDEIIDNDAINNLTGISTVMMVMEQNLRLLSDEQPNTYLGIGGLR